jgi:hypothetical protein
MRVILPMYASSLSNQITKKYDIILIKILAKLKRIIKFLIKK